MGAVVGAVVGAMVGPADGGATLAGGGEAVPDACPEQAVTECPRTAVSTRVIARTDPRFEPIILAPKVPLACCGAAALARGADARDATTRIGANSR